MDREDYESKVKQMLDDKRTYEVLKSDPTPKYKKELVGKLSKLKQEGKITQQDIIGYIPRQRMSPGCIAHRKSIRQGTR